MNALIFGTCIFASWPEFFKGLIYGFIYFFVIYFIFGSVALLIRSKIPAASELFFRIAIMLPVFYVMNILSIMGIYYLYNHIPLLDCRVRPSMFWWAILYGCIMSSAITFINEGLANWEQWKESLSEKEKLQNVYQRSKILGLKGQINPHFLFNCFNTLSGLIQEDEAKAERFLDEMTRVHRYLLRNDDEFLVPLADEIRFAQAYLYLTEQRFGEAIATTIDVDEATLQKRIPPLSMQVILENIIYTNAISKKNPLTILIEGRHNDLSIKHSLNEKTTLHDMEVEEGLDNLLNKYKLLNAGNILVEERDHVRNIFLPLFRAKEDAV